jgi:hypothetical protein
MSPSLMPWNDEFWRPIKLRNGHALTTLGDARELIATLSSPHHNAEIWRETTEKLSNAAAAPSARDEALAAMVRALKAQGLI